MGELDGDWTCTAKTPIGVQVFTLSIATEGNRFSGRVFGDLGSKKITDGAVNGNRLDWQMEVKKPMKMALNCTVSVDGDKLAGVVKAGWLGTYPVSGVRAAAE
jgi:hypothetical protein